MLYISYRIHLTEEGRSNPERVKLRLHELLGDDIFAHLSVDTYTVVHEDNVQSMNVLEAGIEMTPGTKEAHVGNKEFSEFVTQIDEVTCVERLAGA